jgi:RimJ/RimL family protein N-acetyltransferase
MTTELYVIDDVVLEDLVEVAVDDADPEEVMPPVEGPPGWTPARVDALRDFHRVRYGGLDGPKRDLMYAVVHDGHVVGSIRMSRLDEPGRFETGMWLCRSARGRGLGAAALAALLREAAAAGATTVVADTTPDNVAALGALRRCGAELVDDPEAGKVRAELRLS